MYSDISANCNYFTYTELRTILNIVRLVKHDLDMIMYLCIECDNKQNIHCSCL